MDSSGKETAKFVLVLIKKLFVYSKKIVIGTV